MLFITDLERACTEGRHSPNRPLPILYDAYKLSMAYSWIHVRHNYIRALVLYSLYSLTAVVHRSVYAQFNRVHGIYSEQCIALIHNALATHHHI